MDNHIHLLLLGVLSDCLTYVDTVLHRLSLQLKTGICQANHMEITPIKGVIHLRNEICYIHRNPYKARIASPQSYPWSSACLYFCPFFEKGEPIGNLGKRDQRALFHTGLTIKPDLMHRDGLILPTSFVSLTLGQKAFDNSVQYFDILRRYNLEAEVAENHGVHESITFSDKEMEQKISIILQNEYHVKDLHQLDRKDLLMLELTRFSWTGLTICHSHRLNGDCVPSRRAYPAKFFMVLRLRRRASCSLCTLPGSFHRDPTGSCARCST